MRAFLVLALLCSSCLAANKPHDDLHGDAALATQPAAEAAAPKKKAKTDFAALEFAVTSAERRVAAAGAAAKLSRMEAEVKVQAAERAVHTAEVALEHLQKVKIPARLAKEDLGVDRTAGRLEDSEAELAQLEAMYADEEFAESSKELVIRRSKRSVDFARRGLEMARAARADLESYELAKELEDAVQNVATVKQKLESAKLRLEETLFGIETKAMEAAEALRKAKRALDEARAKAEETA